MLASWELSHTTCLTSVIWAPLHVEEVQVLGIFVHKKGPAEYGKLPQTFHMSHVQFPPLASQARGDNEKVKILLRESAEIILNVTFKTFPVSINTERRSL